MAEAEKVLYGLHCLKDYTFGVCAECPYKDSLNCLENIATDAFETLEKNTPKPVVVIDGVFKCPVCGMGVDILNTYCWHCGQKLDWASIFKEG